MNRILHLLVLGGLLVIWTASCKGVNIDTPAPSLTPDIPPQWWNSWLTEPVCKPPCWQNITPGSTTLKEAVSILESSPDIKIRYSASKGVDWNFIPNKNEGGELGASQDGIVRSITLGGDSEKKLLLQTIIASYGDPKYVKNYDCRNYMCATFLIYPDLGLLVDIFVENTGRDNENPQIKILPDLVSSRVFFIEPRMENFKKIPSFQDYGSPMEWKGYGVYP